MIILSFLFLLYSFILHHMFARFFLSFTPNFLQKYQKISVGRSIGYYFFWWLMLWVLVLVVGLPLGWHFTQSEKVLPYLNKIPPFELQFANNELVRTNFPEDPYYLPGDNFQFMFSPTLTQVPEADMDIAGLYVLRDGVCTVQEQGMGHRVQKMSYVDMDVGDVTLNYANLADTVASVYPQVRKTAFVVAAPIISFVLVLFTSLAYFVMCFFWALLVWGISQLTYPKLSYETSLSFVLHVFFCVMLITWVIMVFGFYVPFLMTFLILLAYLLNSFSAKTKISRSVRKK
jgi:Protein of unknown function (DUF1189)